MGCCDRRLNSVRMVFAAKMITLAVVGQGCSNQQGKSASQGPINAEGADNSDERRSLASAKDVGDSRGIDIKSLIPSGTPILEATYQLSAKAAGIQLCEGSITMRVNATIGKSNNASLFELPSTEVECALIGKLNLKPIVGLYSDSKALPKPIVEKNVMFFDRIGETTFTPPRPFLPSFLASSREELKSLNLTRQVTVKDKKRNKTGSGSMTIRMVEFGRNYGIESMGRDFPDSFTFEVVNQGFDNIDKASNVIFDRIAMSMSLNPVSILALSFSGDAQSLKQTALNNPDLVSGPFGQLITVLPDANSNGISGLFGSLIDSVAKIIKVDLQLVLKNQKGLSKSGEGLSQDDDGVKIGK